MRVKRNFDNIYATEEDPWAIGSADSDRYNAYRDLLLAHAHRRGTMLDIGCGYGAFLARFRDEFGALTGLDVSAQAVARGRDRFPELDLVPGSAARLHHSFDDAAMFDAIVCSDVIYYLRERDRRRVVSWIGRHLEKEGLAFIAAWAPGGRYLDRPELRRLVEGELFVEREVLFEETGHVALVCRRRRRRVALTVDYETWQPLPDGFVIDWEVDVFTPTERLLAVAEENAVPLTLFAEMGEYLWLRAQEPEIAGRMEEQWRDAMRRGHDVQLHLHPNWTPEMGARHDERGWWWDMERPRAHDYEGDLELLVARAKQALEEAIRPVSPGYRVTSYRAGTYEAQPFERLSAALRGNGILADSSVLPYDRRAGRHYDYRLAYSRHQPYFASRIDPQLKAPPSERELVELPVFAPPGTQRWTWDAEEATRFAGRLKEFADSTRWPHGTSEVFRWRRRLRTVLLTLYSRTGRFKRVVNRLLPRRVAWFMADYPPERLTAGDYFVMVAHTKGPLDYAGIAGGLRELRADRRFEFVSLSDMAEAAREELGETVSRTREDEAERQVRREYDAILAPGLNVAQSEVLLDMVPLDRTAILDAGCGGGDWSAVLADRLPASSVIGVDVGEEFVAHARRRFASDRVTFAVEDFAGLSFADGSFDCVYADNTLEHAFDVDTTLSELWRVLRDGGCLVAAIPADALNPGRVCDNHTWKTAPHDVRERLASAGFERVEIVERDTFRQLGMSPYPPSRDRMMYVRCWRARPDDRKRVRDLTAWTYRSLSPERCQVSERPREILAGGFAWCWGYVLVLGEALRREGFAVRYVTMTSESHPRALEEDARESHEVLEVALSDGRYLVCDPMAGVVFNWSAGDLIADPARAGEEPAEVDRRWRERRYGLYATAAWYRTVEQATVRSRPDARPRWRTAEEIRRRAPGRAA